MGFKPKPSKAISDPKILLAELAKAAKHLDAARTRALVPATVKNFKKQDDLWWIFTQHGLAFGNCAGRTDEQLVASRALLEAAYKLDKNPLTYVNMSWVLLTQKEYAPALVVCKKGLRADDVHPILFENAAYAFANTGDVDNALKQVRMRKKADPALGLGAGSYKNMKSESDFRALRAKKRFSELFKPGHEFALDEPWDLPHIQGCYFYDETKAKNFDIPPLLLRFGRWLSCQPHGHLGWFDGMGFGKIWKNWDPKLTPSLNRDGFVFLTQGEGSMLVILTGVRGEGEPAPIVELGSEGGEELIAQSLEEFLIAWSKGERTGVLDIDDEDGDDSGQGRPAFRKWLRAQGVKKPKIKEPFDLDAYLDGLTGAKPVSGPDPSAIIPAKMRKLVEQFGRSRDKLPSTHVWISLLGRDTADSELSRALTKAGIDAKKIRPSQFADRADAADGVTLVFADADDFGLKSDARSQPKILKEVIAHLPTYTQGLPFSIKASDSRTSLRKRFGKPAEYEEEDEDDEFFFFDEWDHLGGKLGVTYGKGLASIKTVSFEIPED